MSVESLVQQVATQLAQTDALLDKYVNMLGKSEAVAKLIFDEQWEGAEAVSRISFNHFISWCLLVS